jgi:hypothetical protein
MRQRTHWQSNFPKLSNEPCVEGRTSSDRPSPPRRGDGNEASRGNGASIRRRRSRPFRLTIPSRNEWRSRISVEHAEPPRTRRLLRTDRERPRCRGAAEKRDELAAPHHSITSSARPSSVSGKVMASALAVFKLMISPTLLDCCTGRSAGFSPFRIRAA